MAAPLKGLIRQTSDYFVKACFTPPIFKQFHLATSLSGPVEFDPSILDTVVCPLSKNPLRYDAAASELVNDELGVAYKIIDGIPNLIPQDARMIKQDKDSAEKKTDETNEKTQTDK